MAVIGLGAVWLGGPWFLAVMVLATGGMIGELGLMLAQDQPRKTAIGLAFLAAATVMLPWISADYWGYGVAGLLVVPVLGAAVLHRDKALYFTYALTTLFAVTCLLAVRQSHGLPATLWIILVVIASDIGGYFCGRIIGGPKILPRISPKKTWSGTLGGWVLAAAVGGGFVGLGLANVGFVWLSILVAVAAQAGDMAESAIKRHAKVKDASTLIPGHGGLLDRFDGLIGAGLAVLISDLLIGLPMGGN